MQNIIKGFIISIVLMTILFSCNPTVKNVAGTYFARHNKGTESVEFKTDSTYTHILKTATGEKKQTGTWKLTEENMIIINDWITWVSPKTEDPSINASATVVVPYNDNAIIMFAEEEDYNFYKK